jgi:hypothetical protein
MDFWDLFPVVAPVAYSLVSLAIKIFNQIWSQRVSRGGPHGKVSAPAEVDLMSSIFKMKVGRYRLPVFQSASVLDPAGRKLEPGSTHEVFSVHTDAERNEWWQISTAPGVKAGAWVVATSNGVKYATQEGASAGVAPDDPAAPWRAELRREQAGQPWVKASVDEARAGIDPRATPMQRAVAENIISLIGILEVPSGSNRGPALSGLVGEYVEHHKISNKKDTTGLAWCALAAQWAQAEALGIKWATPSAWSAHPLGNWWGAVWMQEKEAKKRGVWTPCSDLKGDECLTGALLVQVRSGSGSDRGSSRVRSDGSYDGHVDVVIGWRNGQLLCVGGNLGNTAKPVLRDIRDARCRGVIPARGA